MLRRKINEGSNLYDTYAKDAWGDGLRLVNRHIFRQGMQDCELDAMSEEGHSATHKIGTV